MITFKVYPTSKLLLTIRKNELFFGEVKQELRNLNRLKNRLSDMVLNYSINHQEYNFLSFEEDFDDIHEIINKPPYNINLTIEDLISENKKCFDIKIFINSKLLKRINLIQKDKPMKAAIEEINSFFSKLKDILDILIKKIKKNESFSKIDYTDLEKKRDILNKPISIEDKISKVLAFYK